MKQPGRGRARGQPAGEHTDEIDGGRRQRRPEPVLAKLSPPRLHDVYRRSRLFVQMDRAHRSATATWIAAPGGSGKTTLVASWLQARKLRCAWYRIDRSDADPATFFHHLSLAVQRATPRRRRPLPRLALEHFDDLSTFSRNFFRALGSRLPTASVLVFDDVHEADPRLHELLCAGVQELAACVHVVLISRAAAPATYARMRANRELLTLDERELKLREPESQAVARLLSRNRARPDAAQVRSFHERCEGWIAGLILLLEGAASGAPHEAGLDEAGTQPLFDYFAAEVFSHRPPADRDFLMHTALFEDFTVEMAQRLTGNANARVLLEDLVRQHHFTERHGIGQAATYRFHPLFRHFLREQARATWQERDLSARQRSAADILEALDRPEQALDQCLDAGDHAAAVRLILANAPSLAMAGRFGVIETAIGRLPDSALDGEPWLQYWSATCERMTDPATARERFIGAYRSFSMVEDARGCYLAWAGIMECSAHIWDDLQRLQYWFAEFDSLERRFQGRVPLDVEERAVGAMFVAHVVFHIVEWDAIGKWVRRAERIARQGSDVNLRMVIVAALGLYYQWMGELTRYDALLEVTLEQAKGSSATPLARLHVALLECQRLLLQGEPRRALEAIRDAAALAESSGVRVLDRQICVYLVYAHAQSGELPAAHVALDRFRALMTPDHKLSQWYLAFMHGYLVALGGNLSQAQEHVRQALRIAEAGCTSMPIALAQLSLARLLVQSGSIEEARVLVESALIRVRPMRSRLFEVEGRFVQALLHIRAGEEAAGIACLRRAFALMERHGFRSYAVRDDSFLASVCMLALEHDVHAATARELIALHGLIPGEEATMAHSWPWPVKVHALGRFEVLVNDAPVRFAVKAQRRPLELLQVLIALGGRATPAEEVMELLWPHSEGDAAWRALEVTLHRLRKLLCCERALVVQSGKISLDARYVWLDTWALERWLAQGDAGKPPAAAMRVLALYRGPFLGRDAPPWALPMRERMRSMFLRALERIADAHVRHARVQDAIDCYRRGIEADPLCESLYRGLMCCYARLGRHSEALAAYERCRALLDTQLGVAPSRALRRLHRRLLNEASSVTRVTRRSAAGCT